MKCAFSLFNALKVMIFVRLPKPKNCQKSKDLTSPKRECSSLICFKKALAKIMTQLPQVSQS